MIRVSVVLLLAALTASPALVAAQPPSPGPRPTPRFSDPDPNPTPPPAPVVPPASTEPPPAEPLTPTILSEPPTEPTVPVPVIPLTIPTVEGAPPPPISSAPTRVLPTLTNVGTSRAVFVFQPSVSLSEEYTDNFDLTKTNKHSNFRTAIAPTLLFSLDSGPVKGIISYTFTANHDSFHDEMLYFHSVLGQVSWQATPRLRFTVADAFIHNDQPAEADSLGLRRERGVFTSNAFSATADYALDRVDTRTHFRWNTFSNSGSGGGDTDTKAVGTTAVFPLYTENTVTLGYEYIKSHTSESTGDSSQGNNQTFLGSQDVNGHEFTASLGRKFNPRLTGGVSGSYAFRDVSGDAVNSGNFQLWNASLFATYGTTPFTVTGKIGLTGLSSDSGGSRGPDPLFSATASYAFARTLVSLTLEHGFAETFETGQNFGVVETTGALASLTYTLTPRTFGTISAYYRKTETTGIGGGESIAGGPNIGSSKSDVNELVGANVTVTVGLLQWLKLTLSYTYTHRFDNNSNGTTAQGSDNFNEGYTENRARIALDFIF